MNTTMTVQLPTDTAYQFSNDYGYGASTTTSQLSVLAI